MVILQNDIDFMVEHSNSNDAGDFCFPTVTAVSLLLCSCIFESAQQTKHFFYAAVFLHSAPKQRPLVLHTLTV